MPTSTLTTERLLLRSALPQDFEQLFSGIFADEEVMRHLSGVPLEAEKAQKLFADAFDHEGTGRKLGVLVERASLAVIGYAGLMECTALGEQDFELGFVLKRKVWGKGYATEMGRAQLEYGFKQTDRPRLLAQVRPANDASASALQKIGMVFHSEYERASRGTWHIYLCGRDA